MVTKTRAETIMGGEDECLKVSIALTVDGER